MRIVLPHVISMKILSNSDNTNHSAVFETLCRNADEILMVSPFCYSDFSIFADVLDSSGGIQKALFVTTLKTDEVVGKIDSLLSFRDEMNRIKVQWEMHVDNHLHGKIYIFKKDGLTFAGIITSANLTHNGMVANHKWGCLIDDEQQLNAIEQQVLKDAPDQLTNAMLDEIKERVKKKFPEGAKKDPVVTIDIEDIIHPFAIAKDTRICIKPVGVSNDPIYGGDYSKETDLYFSTKRPNAVRVEDILITYAVGGRKIMGAYKVKSEPFWDEDGDPRWPWYVESDCLTPCLANCKWADVGFHVTGIANEYVEKFNKAISHTGRKNLNALNIGWDRVQLDDEYGKYLLGKIMDLESRLQEDDV